MYRLLVVAYAVAVCAVTVAASSIRPGTWLSVFPNSSDAQANNYQFNQLSGLAVATSGSVYVVDQLYSSTSGGSTERVVVLAPTGRMLSVFPNSSDPSDSANEFRFLHVVKSDTVGHVYVTARLNASNAFEQIVQLSATGALVNVFPNADNQNYSFYSINDLAIDGVGNMFVSGSCSFAHLCLWKLSSSGLLLAVNTTVLFGAIAVDFNGTLYAAGLDSKVSVVSRDLTVLRIYPDTGAPYSFTSILALAVDGVGNVYVADAILGRYRSRIVVLSPDGVLLQTFINATSNAISPNFFTGVVDMAVDRAGNIFVADTAADNNGTGRIIVVSGLNGSSVPAVLSATVCSLMYSLPGSLDYPFSIVYSFQIYYNPGVVQNTVTVINGTGTRTFTNRFGATSIARFSVNGGGTLYLNDASPLDQQGLTMSLLNETVQQPGAGPDALTSSLRLARASSNYITELGAAVIDPMGSAFVTSIQGVTNSTIGASNLNAISADYVACVAPITFSNGLRAVPQPVSTNGGLVVRYSYTISDGLTYAVSANLTLYMSSQFATSQDKLGNPYQVVLNVTGTRQYEYFPTGQKLVSTVFGSHKTTFVQKFYPYSLLSASPGVYSVDSAPFLDAEGFAMQVTPSVPSNGAVIGSPFGTFRGAVNVYLMTVNSSVVLTEGYAVNAPVARLQSQTYSF